MKEQPKISVIIPVYNVEEYLRQCLDSIVNQTLKEIEIICVDDASTDASPEILRSYAEKDPRVRLCFSEKNGSAFCARKRGVELAAGMYIMFADADDYLELSACEELYEKIRSENVDILNFSSAVERFGNVHSAKIEESRQFALPCEGRLEGEEVFNRCFETHSYGHYLWNKVFRSELCQRAYHALPDEYLPRAEDCYAYFVISTLAESYFGWIGKPYYHYCLGRGKTGPGMISLELFEAYCTRSKVAAALRRYCEKEGLPAKRADSIDRLEAQWLNACIHLWLNRLQPEDAEKAFPILTAYWDSKKLTCALAEKNYGDPAQVAKKLKNPDRTRLRDGKIRRIGVFFYRLAIGGIERVMSVQIDTLRRLGYEVVAITEEEPSENDFPIPAGTPRERISACNCYGPDFRKRMEDWERIVRTHSLDLVIHHLWCGINVFWDSLYLKQLGVSFIVQTHSVFSSAVTVFARSFADRAYTFRLADGIIALSECDKQFWDRFYDNVHHITNPIGDYLNGIVPNQGRPEPILVWVARYSEEKQPVRAINILSEVVKMKPDVKLFMLGGGDAETIRRCKDKAREKHVEENVSFLGFQKDVGSYYRRAAVNLNTSTYEGFLMTRLEAMAYGVPTVMYDMPFMDFADREHGTIGVEFNQDVRAALEIVRLLTDEAYYEQMRQAAIRGFEEIKNLNYADAWSRVLKGESLPSAASKLEKQMAETMVSHYRMGWQQNHRKAKATDARHQREMEKLRAELKREKLRLSRLQKKLDRIETSRSYRIGRAVTWVPRKLRGGLRCVQEHGMAYTLRRLGEHIRKH